MALDNAQFISELSPIDPPGTDPLNQGDDHIRTTKLAVQQSFPNVGSAVPQTGVQMAQMAIKNESNIFTAVNTFQPRQDFEGNIRITSTAAGSARTIQFFADGLRKWELRMNEGQDTFELTRSVAGIEQDNPWSVANTDGRVTFSDTIQVNNQIRCGKNLLMLQQTTNAEDIDIRFQQFSPAATRWRIRSTATSFNFQIRRQDANGVFLNSPITIAASTGAITLEAGTVTQQIPVGSTLLAFNFANTSVVPRWGMIYSQSTGELTIHTRSVTGALEGAVFQLLDDGRVIMPRLPTADPGGAGILWKNGNFMGVT